MSGKRWLLGLAVWMALYGAYLLYVSQLPWSELLVGAVASLGIAVLLALRYLPRYQPISPAWRWLAPTVRLPWAVLWESWLLMGALARRLVGKPVAGTFLSYPNRLRAEDLHAAALRAWITYGVCFSPNSYVVQLDDEAGTILIRQLVGRELSSADRPFLELQ